MTAASTRPKAPTTDVDTPDLSTSTASAAIFLPDRLRLDEARVSLAAAADALDGWYARHHADFPRRLEWHPSHPVAISLRIMAICRSCSGVQATNLGGASAALRRRGLFDMVSTSVSTTSAPPT